MTGTTLGHYRLLKKLDQGQLGTLYLAQDTRLERHVVLNVLAEKVRSSATWLTRVQETARTVALLNHPHLARVYSIEEAEWTGGGDDELPSHQPASIPFITMEHVPGPSLQEVIPSTGMALDRCLPWCVALADALHHAHTRGCVHGALTPLHIRLREGQTPKILVHIPCPQGDPLDSSDMTMGLMTQATLTSDTMLYLAPERMEGKEADVRSDIYSFGMMMYQLLTGQRSASAQGELPSVRIVRPDIPAEFDRIVRKCLKANVERRYQSMMEVRNDLEELQQERVAPAHTPHPNRPRRLASARLLIGGGLFLMAGALLTYLIVLLMDRPEAVQTRRFQVPFEATLGHPSGAAISPDGRIIVYTHRGRLWLRDLDRVDPHELPGTIGAGLPFWSPDNAYIGYVRDENPPVLMKQPVDNGASVTLCTLPSQPVYGITWRTDGSIILGLAGASGPVGLYAVSDQSGALTPFLLPDSTKHERMIAYPTALPDGQTLLYSVMRTDGATVDLVVRYRETNRTLRSNVKGRWYRAAYAPSGYVVYQDGVQDEQPLWAIPFDWAKRKVVGPPLLIAADGSYPSVSADGTLVYTVRTEPPEQLVRIHRSGRPVGPVGAEQERILDVALAPDGVQVAVQSFDQENANIVVHGPDTPTMPLTFDLAYEASPAWSPDGQEVVFVRRTETATDLFRKRVGGSREAIQITRDAHEKAWPAWSPDGRYVLYQRREADPRHDLWYVSVSEGAVPRLFFHTGADERTPVFSPDGQYVAYASNATGRYEIYVRPFPEGDDEWHISNNGGLFPQWVGNELFFVQNNTLMVVHTDTRSTLHWTPPRTLLIGDQLSTTLADHQTRRYAVTADGEYLVIVQPGRDRTTALMIVEHWDRALASGAQP